MGTLASAYERKRESADRRGGRQPITETEARRGKSGEGRGISHITGNEKGPGTSSLQKGSAVQKLCIERKYLKSKSARGAEDRIQVGKRSRRKD